MGAHKAQLLASKYRFRVATPHTVDLYWLTFEISTILLISTWTAGKPRSPWPLICTTQPASPAALHSFDVELNYYDFAGPITESIEDFL
jgi:hypothetical protein